MSRRAAVASSFRAFPSCVRLQCQTSNAYMLLNIHFQPYKISSIFWTSFKKRINQDCLIIVSVSCFKIKILYTTPTYNFLYFVIHFLPMFYKTKQNEFLKTQKKQFQKTSYVFCFENLIKNLNISINKAKILVRKLGGNNYRFQKLKTKNVIKQEHSYLQKNKSIGFYKTRNH